MRNVFSPNGVIVQTTKTARYITKIQAAEIIA